MRTALVVPLIQAEVVIGMLLLMRVFANAPYTETDLEVAETFTAQATLAVQNAQLAADRRDVAARQKDLEQYRAPAWEELNRHLDQILSTLSDVAHKMLDVPVDALNLEQRRQFMDLQNAGQHLQALLKQAAAARIAHAGPEDAPPTLPV